MSLDPEEKEYRRAVRKTAYRWKKAFPILDDWKMYVSFESQLKGAISTCDKTKTAWLHPWPNKESPEDFYLHEFLHLVLRAQRLLPRKKWFEAEETTVRRLCGFISRLEQRPEYEVIDVTHK